VTADPTAVALAIARSFLFVPGHRPERFAKAAASGADAVVLDLEDAVPAERKADAREAIGAYLATGPATPTLVRCNALDSDAGLADLDSLARWTTQAGLMVAKTESADALTALQQSHPGSLLIPIIESLAGLDAIDAIAAAPGVLRLAFGHIDFTLDLGLEGDDEQRALDPVRLAIAMATRRAQRAPAIDGVTAKIDDDALLEADTRRALRFGFCAKLCIHPAQIATVHRALAPDAGALDWARRVVDADTEAGGAAVQLDGRMIDRPVVLQAHRTLARAAVGRSG